MENYQYLIIGGGMAAGAAAKGIREIDPDGTIGVVSLDIDPPYKRPYLSKQLWKGKPFESVWFHMEEAMSPSIRVGRSSLSMQIN